MQTVDTPPEYGDDFYEVTAIEETRDRPGVTSQPQPIEEFYLTGIRTDGRSEGPNFFTFLIAQGGNLLPLTAKGRVSVN